MALCSGAVPLDTAACDVCNIRIVVLTQEAEQQTAPAQQMLGIARDSLYRHMKRFGIEEDNPAAD